MPAIPITRVAHCNVNCSSLERSRPFYEDVVGLRPATHTAPAPQPAGGFPLSADTAEVQWDAWIMHDHRGPLASPAVDLLEWKRPAPSGRPYDAANHLGFYRLCYLVPSVDEMHGRFVAGGGRAISAPGVAYLDAEGKQAVKVFLGLDPDGTCLEFVESAVPSTQSIHVNVNCSDLEKSLAWYTGNLGLVVNGHSKPGPQPGELFGFEGECEWEAYFLTLPGGDFTIDLLQWQRPAPVGRPYESANNLGIYRLAFMVQDIHACYETLIGNRVDCSGPPVALDMGPEVPIEGGLWALFFRDPDGACVELIEEPPARAG